MRQSAERELSRVDVGVSWSGEVRADIALADRRRSIALVARLRTALCMCLGAVVSTLGSVAMLGEVLAPVQATGGAIMLVALCAFQLRR